VILIIGVTTVYMQVKHMRSVDIGASLDETIAIRMPRFDLSDSAYNSMLSPLKSEVMSNPAVKSVTMADGLPGTALSEVNTTMLSRVGKEAEGQYEYYWYEFDENFVSTMKMSIVAGRDFVNQDYGNVLINEEAAQRFGYAKPEDAIGTQITFYDWRTKKHSTIVGVVKNFYQRSPKETHLPMMFMYNNAHCRFFTARLETKDIAATIASLKDSWGKIFPGEPFNYFFADDNFDQQYHTDVQFGNVMATFSTLAIVIACLGLFGLSSYTILQRRKEIGIRKVLGASIAQVVTLLSGSYLKIILVAALLAVPVSWLAVDNWLSGYTVRINMTVWMFAIPILLILVTALITVSFQTIRSALVNPATSLKDE
jgi:putative ABC transport system permease protein